jgi:hypothetical protein
MGTRHLEDLSSNIVIAPVFWSWAQQHAAPHEPLHLTRRRAIQMQLRADVDLVKAVHRPAFLALTTNAKLRRHKGSRVRRHRFSKPSAVQLEPA